MSEEMSEKTKILRESQDAQVWAEWFVATKESCGWKLKDIDEGLMLCWFANCMMAVRDFGPERKRIAELEAAGGEAVKVLIRAGNQIGAGTKFLSANTVFYAADMLEKVLEGKQ